jgi:hypothetical protein
LAIHRTTFARQAANLSAVERATRRHPAGSLATGEPAWLVASMPVEVFRFARDTFCRRLMGDAAFGYGPTTRTTAYGFRVHARCTPAGAVVGSDLAPAIVSDVAMVDPLDPPPGSLGVGDRSYWPPPVRDELATGGVTLLAPFKNRSTNPAPARSRRLGRVRRVVGTVFGQLAGRFRMKRTWARDPWHLSHRVSRRVLWHTVAGRSSRADGRRSLNFDGLAAV